MSATTTPAQTRRFVGKCDRCKRKVARDLTPKTIIAGRYAGGIVGTVEETCPCHPFARVFLNIVSGRPGPKPCNGVCMAAVGPSCDCQCAGANHGAKHLA